MCEGAWGPRGVGSLSSRCYTSAARGRRRVTRRGVVAGRDRAFRSSTERSRDGSGRRVPPVTAVDTRAGAGRAVGGTAGCVRPSADEPPAWRGRQRARRGGREHRGRAVLRWRGDTSSTPGSAPADRRRASGAAVGGNPARRLASGDRPPRADVGATVRLTTRGSGGRAGGASPATRRPAWRSSRDSRRGARRRRPGATGQCAAPPWPRRRWGPLGGRRRHGGAPAAPGRDGDPAAAAVRVPSWVLTAARGRRRGAALGRASARRARAAVGAARAPCAPRCRGWSSRGAGTR